MSAGDAIAITGMAISSAVGAGGLLLVYMREKQGNAKWAGSLETEVKNCKEGIKKLENIPQQLVSLDERLNGLPDKLTKIEKRLQTIEDICPKVHKLGVRDKDEDCTD